jgi:hypothetical protein
MFKNAKKMKIKPPWNTKAWQWYLEARKVPPGAGLNGRDWDVLHVRKLI